MIYDIQYIHIYLLIYHNSHLTPFYWWLTWTIQPHAANLWQRRLRVQSRGRGFSDSEAWWMSSQKDVAATESPEKMSIWMGKYGNIMEHHLLILSWNNRKYGKIWNIIYWWLENPPKKIWENMIWISLVDFPAIWKNDQRVLRKYLVHLDEASGWFRPEALTNLALNSQLMWFFGINLIIPPAQHWIRQSNGLLMFVGESSALFQFYQITQRGFWSTMWIDTLLNGCFHEKLRKDMIYMVIMVYNGRTWEHIVKDWWTLINIDRNQQNPGFKGTHGYPVLKQSHDAGPFSPSATFFSQQSHQIRCLLSLSAKLGTSQRSHTTQVMVGVIIPNIWRKKNVPNHQPVIYYYEYIKYVK